MDKRELEQLKNQIEIGKKKIKNCVVRIEFAKNQLKKLGAKPLPPQNRVSKDFCSTEDRIRAFNNARGK